MKIELIREKDKGNLEIKFPSKVTSLKIWFCKFKTLDGIRECINLQELVIAGYPGDNLDFLSSLSKLTYLEILHLPKVTNLEPLSHLSSLEVLSLETSPSWDSSGKRLIVDSLEPITKLSKLKNLQLFRVCPKDNSLKSLEKSTSLFSVRASGYPKGELKRFYEVTSFRDDRAPESSFD